jgi:hypothetical protein
MFGAPVLGWSKSNGLVITPRNKKSAAEVGFLIREYQGWKVVTPWWKETPLPAFPPAAEHCWPRCRWPTAREGSDSNFRALLQPVTVYVEGFQSHPVPDPAAKESRTPPASMIHGTRCWGRRPLPWVRWRQPALLQRHAGVLCCYEVPSSAPHDEHGSYQQQ